MLANICVCCLKPNPQPERKTCPECLKRIKEWKRQNPKRAYNWPKKREYQREYNKVWRKKNRDRLLAQTREWRKKNRDRLSAWSLKWRLGIKKRALQLLGGKCVNCGVTDLRLLNIHHKNGRKNDYKGINLYRRILKGLEDLNELEVRCWNCNVLAEYEKGKYHHLEQL